MRKEIKILPISHFIWNPRAFNITLSLIADSGQRLWGLNLSSYQEVVAVLLDKDLHDIDNMHLTGHGTFWIEASKKFKNRFFDFWSRSSNLF